MRPAAFWNFYPRSPCGERLRALYALGLRPFISIHALLAESDRHLPIFRCRLVAFLSTLSLRRATFYRCRVHLQHRYFYPRSPCGERREAPEHRGYPVCISIHALLAESDTGWSGSAAAPRYFYPRSPCGERPRSSAYRPLGSLISIHALLAESDSRLRFCWARLLAFLSTLSLRRATSDGFHRGAKVVISIHALLAESDHTFVRPPSNSCDFYPRSPCGERQAMAAADVDSLCISIHALLAESDSSSRNSGRPCRTFLSTLSLRRATVNPTVPLV